MKNIVLGVFCLVFAAVIFLVTLQFPEADASYKDPAVYPVSILALIALIGIILIVQGYISHRRGNKDRVIVFEETKVPRILILMTIIYVLVMQLIGFTLSTFIYLFLIFLVFGGNKRQGVVFALTLTIVEYALFVWALRVRLPEPLFELAARIL